MNANQHSTLLRQAFAALLLATLASATLALSPVADVAGAQSAAFEPLDAGGGTLSNGVTYTITQVETPGGTAIDAAFVNNIDPDTQGGSPGDIGFGRHGTLIIEFAEPVDYRIGNVTGTFSPHIWNGQNGGGGSDLATATTNGGDWTQAIGSVDPLVDVVGQVITPQATQQQFGTTASADWGSFSTLGATRIVLVGNHFMAHNHQVLVPQSANTNLTSVVTGPTGPVVPGGNASILVEVCNLGGDDASAGHTLTAVIPEGLEVVVGELPAGATYDAATRTVTVAGSALAADACEEFAIPVEVSEALSGTSAGPIETNVTPGGTDVDPEPSDNSGTASVTVGPRQTNLASRVSDPTSPFTPGGSATVVVEVCNLGGNAASAGHDLMVVIPEGLEVVVGELPAGATYDAATRTVTVAGSALAADACEEFAIPVEVSEALSGTSAGPIETNVTPGGTDVDPEPSDNSGTASVPVNAQPTSTTEPPSEPTEEPTGSVNLTTTITGPSTRLVAGGINSVDVRVCNSGDADGQEDFSLTVAIAEGLDVLVDRLPAGATYDATTRTVSVEGDALAVAACVDVLIPVAVSNSPLAVIIEAAVTSSEDSTPEDNTASQTTRITFSEAPAALAFTGVESGALAGAALALIVVGVVLARSERRNRGRSDR